MLLPEGFFRDQCPRLIGVPVHAAWPAPVTKIQAGAVGSLKI